MTTQAAHFIRQGAIPARILIDVPLTELDADPANPRKHLGDIDELAATIHAVGLLQPILVRRTGNRFTIVAGHRRAAAARRLGWPTIPAMIRRDLRPGDVLLAMLTENSARAALDPVEEATALRQLARDQKLGNHDQIATRVGRSRRWVSDRLALLDLTPTEQEAVRQGVTPLAAATRTARERTGTTRTTTPEPAGPRTCRACGRPL